jgi:hypothetical protein
LKVAAFAAATAAAFRTRWSLGFKMKEMVLLELLLRSLWKRSRLLT